MATAGQAAQPYRARAEMAALPVMAAKAEQLVQAVAASPAALLDPGVDQEAAAGRVVTAGPAVTQSAERVALALKAATAPVPAQAGPAAQASQLGPPVSQSAPELQAPAE